MGLWAILRRTAILAALATPAIASPIPNSSFEDTSSGTGWVNGIPAWSMTPAVTATQQRAGLFSSLFSYYSAVNGTLFADITNQGGGSQTLTSSTFRIDNQAIRFSYAYLTQNAGAGGPSAYADDPFTVTLWSSPDGSSGWTYQTFTVTDANDPALSPIPQTTFYGTQWRNFVFFHGLPSGYTSFVSFQIADNQAQDGTSSYLLDNLGQIPEPGTFALFGLGLLGLSLGSRRLLRRRA